MWRRGDRLLRVSTSPHRAFPHSIGLNTVPSPIGHALGAVAAGWAVARPAAPRRALAIQVAILAALGVALISISHRAPQPRDSQRRRCCHRGVGSRPVALARRQRQSAYLAGGFCGVADPSSSRRTVVRYVGSPRGHAALALHDGPLANRLGCLRFDLSKLAGGGVSRAQPDWRSFAR